MVVSKVNNKILNKKAIVEIHSRTCNLLQCKILGILHVKGVTKLWVRTRIYDYIVLPESVFL